MDIYGVIKILSVVPDECNGCLDNSPVANMPLNTAPFVQVTMSHTLLSLGTNHRLSLPPRDTNPPIRAQHSIVINQSEDSIVYHVPGERATTELVVSAGTNGQTR